MEYSFYVNRALEQVLDQVFRDLQKLQPKNPRQLNRQKIAIEKPFFLARLWHAPRANRFQNNRFEPIRHPEPKSHRQWHLKTLLFVVPKQSEIPERLLKPMLRQHQFLKLLLHKRYGRFRYL